MATLNIGYIGENMDLTIRQGATFPEITATMTNPDLSPVNLTGCLIRGQIRKVAASSTITLVLSFTITNALTGQYKFDAIPAATTALLPAGETLTEAASRYVWDCELVDSLGAVTPLYYGTAYIFREVTR
jgi:hypothetical protein